MSVDGRALSDEEIGALGRVLAVDPDPEVRSLAAEAMSFFPETLPLPIVAQGLRDPDDRVRAAMVRTAAARCAPAAPLIARLAARRRWPMAQAAAMQVLPKLLHPTADGAGSEGGLETLLSGVAAMEPPPLGSERRGLRAVARSIGLERLTAELERPGPRRVGAVRLLLAERSPEALRAITPLVDDPVEEVRLSAAAALGMVQAGPAEPGRSTGPTVAPAQDQVIEALALALDDPDEGVRTRARAALDRAPLPEAERWTHRALFDGTSRVARAAASAAETLRLRSAAPPLLARAASIPPEERGPFLGALDSLRLEPADLAAMIPDVDPAVRAEAVRLVWMVGGRSVLDAVAASAGDTAGAVRAAALEVLAESADARAVTVALRALEDDSSAMVRAVAAALLAHQGGPGRAVALARAVEDPEPDVRATAIEALPTEVEPDVLPVLHRALRDPDERVWRPALARVIRSDRGDPAGTWKAIRDSEPTKRRELIRAVEAAGEDEVARLGLRYAEASDWADRALAIEVLARARTPAAIQAILDALEDPDPVVRRAAAGALRSVRTLRAVPALAQSLADPAPDVRMESVRALSLIDDDRVLDPLVVALKDPAMSVREAATDALARWRSPGVARRLAAALRTPELRRPAGALLERMGRAAVEPLVEVVTGDDHEVAAVAGALLSRIAGAESFVQSLSSREPSVRRIAVEVLGAIGGPTSSEALITALGDPDPAVRVRVAALLAELADPRALEPLKRAHAADPVPEVAAAAEDALRRLGGMPGRPPSPDAPLQIREGDGMAGSQES